LLDPKPALSGDERWKKEREEQGLLTWAVSVPRGGEALVQHGVRITCPSWMEVTR
jgi:hypothetical protein